MHPFPPLLEQALLKLAESVSPRTLADQYAELSATYRHEKGHQITSKEQALAYALARMPATYAVLCTVLEQLPLAANQSCLDIGSGPGTTYWALKAIGAEVASLTCVEPNPFMKHITTQTITDPSLPITTINNLDTALSHDIIIGSYVVGELSPSQQKSFIQSAWERTKNVLILTGPGTPAGFQDFARLRTYLIEQKSSIVAPCGHNARCPLWETQDWCHFSTRLERRPFHKILKTATQGYEDEKFVYLIATRAPLAASGERILKKPRHNKGQIIIDTCAGDHVNTYTFIKSKTPDFQKLKKLKWGDVLSENILNRQV